MGQRTLPTQDFSHFQRHLVALNSIQRNSLPQQLLPYLPTSPKWPLWPRRQQLPGTTHYGLATERQQRLQPSLQLTLLIKIPIMILQPNPLQEVWTRPLGSNKVSYILITWRQSWHLVKWLFFNNVCNSKALVDLSFHLLRRRLVSFLFKCKVRHSKYYSKLSI